MLIENKNILSYIYKLKNCNLFEHEHDFEHELIIMYDFIIQNFNTLINIFPHYLIRDIHIILSEYRYEKKFLTNEKYNIISNYMDTCNLICELCGINCKCYEF